MKDSFFWIKTIQGKRECYKSPLTIPSLRSFIAMIVDKGVVCDRLYAR